jgi:hypothetical protein
LIRKVPEAPPDVSSFPVAAYDTVTFVAPPPAGNGPEYVPEKPRSALIGTGLTHPTVQFPVAPSPQETTD